MGGKENFSGRVFQFVLIAISFFVTIPLDAASFHFDVVELGQLRENTADNREVPLNTYLGLESLFPKQNFSSQFNMRFFRDLKQKWDDFDLYQGVVHFQPHEKIELNAGRQFVNQGFFVEVVDGIQTTLAPSKHLDFTLYSGAPRSVELGDFNRNDGLLSGMSLRMKNISRTNAGIFAAWRKFDIHVMDIEQNDEVFVGGNFSHQFAVSMTPMVYGVYEYDVAGKVLNTATVGLDIYPLSRLALNGELHYFNTSRKADRQTIQSLFTEGRLWGGRFSSTWTWVPKLCDFVFNYSYRNVELRNNDTRHGHFLEASFPLTFAAIDLSIDPGYYFEKSFGGRLDGGRLTVHKKFGEKFYAEVAADVTRYRKVTHNNDTAFSSVNWVGVELTKGLNISSGFEFNKNNLFNKEVRGSFRVEYQFDHGS